MVLYQKKFLILCSIHKKWFVRENEMDIKELERQVGLSQMTIQLYENEKLLSPKEIGKNKKNPTQVMTYNELSLLNIWGTKDFYWAK